MDISVQMARVDLLLAKSKEERSLKLLNELHHGALGIMVTLYGPDSSQEKALRTYIEALRSKGHPQSDHTIYGIIDVLRGVLESIKAELDSGFVGSLRATLAGEVLSDFIKLTRATLEESGDGAKNVAAVLAAAAFEDVLRRLADVKGVGHKEKLAEVLMALKDLGVLQGAEVGIAQSYLSFRNRALHAQWNEVDRPAIESALAFTEQLILKHLT
jgi:uncharacterized protein YutE (UPF0331/DUF86 family)